MQRLGASRYHTLNAAAASGLAVSGGKVTVGPVMIPAAVDQPQFVTQDGPNRVNVDEFNRWAAPLSDNIARVVAQDLVVLLGTPDIAVGPLANFIPDYAIAIDVQRFESVRGRRIKLDALWTVRRTAGGFIRSGRTSADEKVSDDSFDALAAAHSRALAMLSDDRQDDPRRPQSAALRPGSVEAFLSYLTQHFVSIVLTTYTYPSIIEHKGPKGD